ncbi:MAG: AAA family ATPase, partial [Sedimentisphaerales bacterium]|nr:AAA family ATPase [Sedimentisphaerales bacterium]
MEHSTAAATLIPPEELAAGQKLLERILEHLDRILLGRRDLHRQVWMGILSRGHILLEGVPGVGKTALVKALGQMLNLQFARVQFTPDLMPGDILGLHILEESPQGGRRMRFEPGPVFTNILLADEINRASPKTQSALLEAMQERHVTLLGRTRPLPEPFFVLASQNPIELEGTYPLPEAQLDRFLFKLIVKDVDAEVLDQIVSTRRRGEPPKPDWSLSAEQLGGLFDLMDRIYLPRPVARYLARLTAATHPGAAEATEMVNKYVSYGASPRAAI